MYFNTFSNPGLLICNNYAASNKTHPALPASVNFPLTQLNLIFSGICAGGSKVVSLFSDRPKDVRPSCAMVLFNP